MTEILLNNEWLLIVFIILILYLGWRIRKAWKNFLFYLVKRKGRKGEGFAVKLLKFNMLGYSSFWQILLDKDGYPATKPPWGGIAKINLESGSTTWKKKFGKRIDQDSNIIADGDKSFGGLMTTKSGLIFSTGTPDKFIYAIDTKSGEELWKYELPYAGSAPPISYMFNGCQYIVTQATGGVFVGFDAMKGDVIAAFKLQQC